VRNSFHARIVRGLIQKINQEALKNALPKVNINDATGPFKFRPAQTKNGKPGGWDTDQKTFIYLVQGGKFNLYTSK
jgi:branched-chain amino acid transport system substrate-binding protein